MERLEDKLTITMIPEGIYREIAEAIGLDNFVRLTRIIGGSTCYFPKTESLLKPVRDEAIREEFNGYNHAELANKYGVTPRWVRYICGDGDVPGQISFEDLPQALNPYYCQEENAKK